MPELVSRARPGGSQTKEGGAPSSRKTRGRCKSHPRRLQRCLQGRSRALTWQAAEIGGKIFKSTIFRACPSYLVSSINVERLPSRQRIEELAASMEMERCHINPNAKALTNARSCSKD